MSCSLKFALPGYFRRSALILLALSGMTAGPSHGDAGMFAPERVGRWYLGGGVGGFAEESESQLRNQSGQVANFFSGGYRLSRNFALEIDGLFYNQRIDTPPAVASSRTRSRLYVGGPSGVLKLILPVERLELYAGAGVGVYNTTLRDNESSFRSEEDDTGVGVQGLVGADYFVSRNISVGMEYRKFKLRAELDPSIPGKIDVGGDFLFVTVRGHF